MNCAILVNFKHLTIIKLNYVLTLIVLMCERTMLPAVWQLDGLKMDLLHSKILMDHSYYHCHQLGTQCVQV